MWGKVCTGGMYNDGKLFPHNLPSNLVTPDNFKPNSVTDMYLSDLNGIIS